MNDLITDLITEYKEKNEGKTKCIIRLYTSSWSDSRGIHEKKSILYLRRKSSGFNYIEEDAANIGVNEIFPKIINLNECKDGIYKVVICNERAHWETPHIIDDYDYKLIPYTEK